MLALAGALAFGLAGRGVASQLCSSAYEEGEEQAEQVKRDARLVKAGAQEQMAKTRRTCQQRRPGRQSRRQPVLSHSAGNQAHVRGDSWHGGSHLG